MSRWLRRSVAFVAVVLLATFGLTEIDGNDSAEAANASRFDPGLIISDSVFYDFGTMTVAEIQRFLNSKVSTCKAAAGDPPCLKDYVGDTPAKPADEGRCDAMEAKTKQTAAQIIYDVAHACGINPRALIVILQKEQGLVQAAKPTAYMYKAAMGYGCPDSDPSICGKVWTGLFNQLHRGAGQLNWYGDPRGSFTYLKVGRNVTIKYSPSSSNNCGSKTFLLKSQATAALYYYTPYTPNDAALKNLYGTGDDCSAYGNRNFWRFFTDWFGNTIGGGFLLQAPGTDPYLIIDDTKYHITDPALVDALEPLGPLGEISADYLASFADGPDMNRLVKNANGSYFFVHGGQRFRVSSCTAAPTYGLNCNTAIALSSTQLAALPVATNGMTAFVSGSLTTPTGDRYLLDNGVKREILDDASVAAENITLPSLAPVDITAFSNLGWGAPIARDGSLLKNRATGDTGVYVGGSYYAIDPATLKDFDFTKWFSAPVGAELPALSAEQLHAIDSGSIITSIFSDETGQQFVLTPEGKRKLAVGSEFVIEPSLLPKEVLDRIPTVGDTITAPVFVKSSAGKTVYLVSEAVRRATVNSADRTKLIPALNTSGVVTLSPSAVDLISAGTTVLGPGSLVQVKSASQLYLLDGLSRALKLPSLQHASLFGFAKARQVKTEDLAGYAKTKQYTGLKLSCTSQTYLSIDGTMRPISESFAAAYPGKTVAMDDLTCATFDYAASDAGRFITLKSGAIYLIQKGTKRLVSSKTQYLALRGGTPFSMKVSDYFASLLPTGKPLKATNLTPIDATSTAGGSSTPSPSPSGSASPSPNPSPSLSPTKVNYTVKSGDTLLSIANKFGVTVTAIKNANNISNANLITVGQKLLIP